MGAIPAITGRLSPAPTSPARAQRSLGPMSAAPSVARPLSPATSPHGQPPTHTVLDPRDALSDEHTVLLWQICAYVDELIDAARTGRGLIRAFETLLKFLHYRLVPYLVAEEQDLAAHGLQPAHRIQQLTEHNEIRETIEAIEAAETESRTLLATAALVTRIDQHARCEQSWIANNDHRASEVVHDDSAAGWVLPLLLTDDIDLDTLPAEAADALVLTRLLRMRCGEMLRLRARHDLHPLWRQLRARNHGDHAWVYETAGPENWVACITRLETDCS